MAEAPIRNDIAKVHAAMPGCGLAAYTGVLLLIMSLGGTMMLMSGLTVFASSDAARPTRLMYGGDANPSMLNGLRYFGLLANDKVPEVLHTENWSGTVVCAIADEVLLRLDDTGAWRLPVASVEQAEMVGGGGQDRRALGGGGP